MLQSIHQPDSKLAFRWLLVFIASILVFGGVWAFVEALAY